MLLLLDLVARLVGAPVGVLPASGAPLATLLLVGLVGATATATLIAALRVTGVLAASRTVPSRSTARDDADLQTLVVQSDPAADGHVRSRAPGRPLSVTLSVWR